MTVSQEINQALRFVREILERESLSTDAREQLADAIECLDYAREWQCVAEAKEDSNA